MDNQPHTLNLDLDRVSDMVGVAVRRASAFMRLGLDDLKERGNGDFNLKSELNFVFWPEKITDEDRANVRAEYEAWLTGGCLRELDQIYGLFLDQVWYAIEVIELHGSLVSVDHVFDQRFSKQTNVAKKQKLVSERLGTSDYYEELNSISLARNALTHNAGFVRSPMDCNAENRAELHVKWAAFDLMRSRGGTELPLFSDGPVEHGLPGDGDVSVLAKPVQRSYVVAAGRMIQFTEAHLAELCAFYLQLRVIATSAVFEFAKSKGLENIDLK
jgi:hypothetical protein